MTRLGWAILLLVVVGGAGFVSLVRIGGPPTRPGSAVPAASAPDTPGPLAVPVAGVARADLRDDWGEARDGGRRAHHGTDIPAPAGTPVLAAAPGRVEKLFHSEAGGITVYVRSADRRWLHYYAHLAAYADGLHEGQPVSAGQPLGLVGDTGDAGAGNYHLHFGLSRLGPGEGWWQGREVDPYPLLAGRAAAR